jgi:Zn-finger nucleic acid-binding protein
MSDQKDRLGDKLHQAESARESQWAHQRDEEILAKLRRKYLKAIPCPQCGQKLEARVAIGVGGMACPSQHGAWADRETLGQLETRLKNAAAIRHTSVGEQVFGDIVDQLSHKHPKEIDCPDCGSRLAARAAVSPGSAGLAGMSCPKDHGAWIDEDMLTEIRNRLDSAAGDPR